MISEQGAGGEKRACERTPFTLMHERSTCSCLFIKKNKKSARESSWKVFIFHLQAVCIINDNMNFFLRLAKRKKKTVIDAKAGTFKTVKFNWHHRFKSDVNLLFRPVYNLKRLQCDTFNCAHCDRLPLRSRASDKQQERRHQTLQRDHKVNDVE